MFEKIQHIGYLTPDLDRAIAWFEESFNAVKAGGGPLAAGYAMPSGGRNAYVRFGNAEAELLEPVDQTGLSSEILTMHHVGYVVADINKSIEELASRGFKFAADKPNVNVLGHQLLYFDSSTTNGVKMHITQLPDAPVDANDGLEVERIIHAGYRVKNLEEAIKWYVDNFNGSLLGGGPSRTGGRNAFVNFSEVQVELIQPPDTDAMTNDHVMDHVGYVVGDIPSCIGECEAHGLKFVSDMPNTNGVGQQVLYFETDTSMGSRMHLTRLPD